MTWLISIGAVVALIVAMVAVFVALLAAGDPEGRAGDIVLWGFGIAVAAVIVAIALAAWAVRRATAEPPAPSTAIDQCLLKEILEECNSELATPAEKADCQRKAPNEATRAYRAIAPVCLPHQGTTR